MAPIGNTVSGFMVKLNDFLKFNLIKIKNYPTIT